MSMMLPSHWTPVHNRDAVEVPTGELLRLLKQDEPWRQEAMGLAFDFGRAQGNLELRQVLLDAEMMRDCDERAREEIERLREELAKERLIGRVNYRLERSAPYAYSELNRLDGRRRR